jgi:hypothetical protein
LFIKADEHQTNERRISETHTAPSRIHDGIRRSGIDVINTSIESSTTKTSDTSSIPQATIDIIIRNKVVSSSTDSTLHGTSLPIHQSTPKTNSYAHDDDAGHESEDELSDPTIRSRKQDQNQDHRRRSSKTRLRDFSHSTSQPMESVYSSQQTRTVFNEANMENMLSHVPASKGLMNNYHHH